MIHLVYYSYQIIFTNRVDSTTGTVNFKLLEPVCVVRDIWYLEKIF